MNGKLLSFCRKRAVIHIMGSGCTPLGTCQPETCVGVSTTNKQHLSEVGMNCGKKHAEKRLFSASWSSSGICDLRILTSTCSASLHGVSTTLPAVIAQNLLVKSQKVHEGGFLVCFLNCWMCCNVYDLLGPSLLPISRFSLQQRIRNLFL